MLPYDCGCPFFIENISASNFVNKSKSQIIICVQNTLSGLTYSRYVRSHYCGLVTIVYIDMQESRIYTTTIKKWPKNRTILYGSVVNILDCIIRKFRSPLPNITFQRKTADVLQEGFRGSYVSLVCSVELFIMFLSCLRVNLCL